MENKIMNNKELMVDGIYTTDNYEKKYLENRDRDILLGYFDKNFYTDKKEFDDSKTCIGRTIGIENVSSNNELSVMERYVMWLGWNPYVVDPADIKRHLLEDMGNINIFKGEITPEFFDSEVKIHLEELEDILEEEPKYYSLRDFEFYKEDPGFTIISCGGIKTGDNRYLYCFGDLKNDSYFGKEFVVDDNGNIHDGTKEWLVIKWFNKRFGKSIFWDSYFGLDKSLEADSDVCYVPGLIALYSMWKYLLGKRNM